MLVLLYLGSVPDPDPTYQWDRKRKTVQPGGGMRSAECRSSSFYKVLAIERGSLGSITFRVALN